MTDRARQHQILAAARMLLEQEGPEALTMRRLAGLLGITAPSLYKHFPDKSSVVDALADAMLTETAEALEAAETAAPGSFPALATAYRAHALAPDDHLARAAWAFAHGMVMMELNNRFPTPESVTTAWTAGITALASSRL
ncbi:TetR/AcrR family transcriptional regulator [Streptomyces sp. IBSBF 3010]|uniref:TetR/AcrR family transcriptional regulator n=1 Tax=Streptomyces sp. IBSBF 3010 TaxID=2903526 RepID=UPI002FDBCD39